MQTASELLAWAVAQPVTALEKLCDEIAGSDDGTTAVELPTLVEPAEREAESKLISCLECRSGGLDSRTPSRTREWLWRGLWTMKVAGKGVETEPRAACQPGEGEATDLDDEEELIGQGVGGADDATEPLIESIPGE